MTTKSRTVVDIEIQQQQQQQKYTHVRLQHMRKHAT